MIKDLKNPIFLTRTGVNGRYPLASEGRMKEGGQLTICWAAIHPVVQAC